MIFLVRHGKLKDETGATYGDTVNLSSFVYNGELFTIN